MAFKKIEPVHHAQKSWFQRFKARKWLVGLVTVVGGVLLMGGTLTAYSVHSAHETAQAAKHEFEHENQQKVSPKQLVDKPNPFGDYSYGSDNDGVPDAKHLKAYLNQKATLSTYGFLAVPMQAGMMNPIKSMPINHGVSNAVLARGIGTAGTGAAGTGTAGTGTAGTGAYTMGHGNNVLAAHNWGGTTFSGNYVLGFSPLQQIDVSKQPTGYQTDGKKIYKFKLDKKQTIDVVKDPGAYQRIALANMKENKVTLVTCDEPRYGFVNLKPHTRIIVSGPDLGEQNYKDAPEAEQALFPQLQR